MRSLFLCLVSLLLVPNVAGQQREIEIKIRHPLPTVTDPLQQELNNVRREADSITTPDPVSIQNFAGWPLIIEYEINNELGIGTDGNPFPSFGETGFIVYEDPDDCLSFAGYTSAPNHGGNFFPWGAGCPFIGPVPVVVPSDETYFEFSSDIDLPGLPDDTGNPSMQATLATNPTDPLLGGPDTGEPGHLPGTGEIDGYGWGADDDLPGAVILMKRGPGIVYQENGVAVSPLTLRNMAGFTNAVSYELNSTQSKTSIISYQSIPHNLIGPTFAIDAGGSGPALLRVDGSQRIKEVDRSRPGTFYSAYFTGYVGRLQYTIQVLAVSGIGPNVVMDMNGDNQIDETDLEAMGYTVLADMKTVTLKLNAALDCFGAWQNVFQIDFNNDGDVGGITQPCPPGSGGLSIPPR